MSIYDPLAEALGIDPIENPSYLLSMCKEYLKSLELDTIPGPKHCDETKLQISESNKIYYQTEEGIKRRKKLSVRNSIVKSEEMKKRWIENYDSMCENTKLGGRKKGSRDKGIRRPKCNIRLITDGNQIFRNANEASTHYNIHVVNIRRKCRKHIDGWRYI